MSTVLNDEEGNQLFFSSPEPIDLESRDRSQSIDVRSLTSGMGRALSVNLTKKINSLQLQNENVNLELVLIDYVAQYAKVIFDVWDTSQDGIISEEDIMASKLR